MGELSLATSCVPVWDALPAHLVLSAACLGCCLGCRAQIYLSRPSAVASVYIWQSFMQQSSPAGHTEAAAVHRCNHLIMQSPVNIVKLPVRHKAWLALNS